MRRRITFAILGTAAAALVLAGLGAVALARADARRATERDLRSDAAAIVELATPPFTRGRARPGGQRLRRIAAGLDLEDIGLLVVRADGRLVGDLPAGVREADLERERLLAGEVVSGHHGSLVYAAASTPFRGADVIAVVTEEARGEPGALAWFVPAGALTLVVGAAAAWWLSRSLTGPLARAAAATRQVAAGDLAVRLPEPGKGRADELAELARSINAMAANLERSRGLERQFLLSVSHDLRTPLTSIRGYAEAILDGAATDPSAAAGTIRTESLRLERLVRDLLDLARLDAHQFRFDPAPVVVGEVVAATADGFRPEADAAGLTLSVATDPGGALALVDPDRLAQVVANLLENALKHATTSVAVGVDADGDAVTVAVADDGPGIAAEDLPHVFERLYVAQRQPTRHGSGSGLGLAIVRELVTAMGGTVHVESAGTGAGGTRLVVRFALSGRVGAPAPPPPHEPRPTSP